MSAPRQSASDPLDSAEIRLLQGEIARLSERLDRLETNRVSRFIGRTLNLISTQKRRAGRILSRSPLRSLVQAFEGEPASEIAYRQWVAWTESLYPTIEAHREAAARWRWRPVVSVLVAARSSKQEWLDRAIQSVTAQSYDHWELCVCGDTLHGLASDVRIKTVHLPGDTGVSESLNMAAQLATGDIVTFLEHDARLHPHAVHYLVEAFQDNEVDVVYSDEDCLDAEGQRVDPSIKPDWSPELLDGCMYLGRALATKRALFERAGGMRKAYEGAQNYDLTLRLAEYARTVQHVPRVLYHGPRAAVVDTNAHEAGHRALSDSIARRDGKAKVVDGPRPCTYTVRRPTADQGISVIVCSRGGPLLSKFLRSFPLTLYKNVELIVVEHLAGRPKGLLAGEPKSHTRIPYEGPFNFSDMNNRGVLTARSDLLVFLNDDVAPLRGDWLSVMASQLEREDIGIVGGKLLYPSGALQHAGVTIGMLDGAAHPGRGFYGSELMPYLDLPRDVSAVTGACLGIRRPVFEELGGFDTEFPVNYNDVDLCLRARELGYRILLDPRIEMVHKECASRFGLTKFAERERFYRRWGSLLAAGDPYYPRAFDRNSEEIRLQIP